ncbi:hypothetical protein Hamer_G024971, partial [Homarus americanus]
IEKNGSGSRQITKYKSHRRPTGPGTLRDASTRDILPDVFKQESARLRTLSEVPGAPVSCTPHTTFNQCRWVVVFKELLQYSEEKLLEELRVQKGVTMDSEAYPASSSECDPVPTRERYPPHPHDKVCFVETRSTALKSVSSHEDSYVQVLSRHEDRRSVDVTSTRESSVPVLNLASTPDSVDEAGTSATLHHSSTHRSGTTKISEKCYRGSSESLDVDDHLAKVSMCRGLIANWEELQLYLNKFSPICICLQETMFGVYDRLPPRGYSDFYSSQNQEEMPHGDTAILFSDKCGVPYILMANDGSSVAAPEEVAELFSTTYAGVSSMTARSRTLDLGVGRGETYNILF